METHHTEILFYVSFRQSEHSKQEEKKKIYFKKNRGEGTSGRPLRRANYFAAPAPPITTPVRNEQNPFEDVSRVC